MAFPPKPAQKSPLDIMNLMASAAHNKAQPAPVDDEDPLPTKGKKSPKQAAAMDEKKKGKAPAPAVPPKGMPPGV